MAEIYARPLYAERYKFPAPGQPLEPEFPFVLPTMLYRWTFGAQSHLQLHALLVEPVLALVGVVARMWVALYRILNMAIGWSDGFIDDERARAFAVAASKTAAKAAVKSILPTGSADGLSMNDDEIL
jgi:hypothetical protein